MGTPGRGWHRRSKSLMGCAKCLRVHRRHPTRLSGGNRQHVIKFAGPLAQRRVGSSAHIHPCLEWLDVTAHVAFLTQTHTHTQTHTCTQTHTHTHARTKYYSLPQGDPPAPSHLCDAEWDGCQTAPMTQWNDHGSPDTPVGLSYSPIASLDATEAPRSTTVVASPGA